MASSIRDIPSDDLSIRKSIESSLHTIRQDLSVPGELDGRLGVPSLAGQLGGAELRRRLPPPPPRRHEVATPEVGEGENRAPIQ